MSESGNQHTDSQSPITPNQQAYDLPMFDNKRLFSLRAHNALVKRLNALTRMRPQRGAADGDLIISDANALLPLESEATSSGSGSGNMNWRGLYSAATDYAVDDVVYTSPDASTRVTWIAVIANGPSTTIATPTWPDSGLAWTALDWFTVPQLYTVQNISGTTVIGSTGNAYVFAAPSGGGSSVYILLPPLLRFTVSSRSIPGGPTISYSSYSASAQSRVANNGITSAVTQYITPMYIAGDSIYVSSAGGILYDMNVDGRTFAGP